MKTYSLQKHSNYSNLYFKYQRFIPKIFRSHIESSILTFSSAGEIKPFDLCISLGNYCLPAMTLDILNLRKYSFPFDWLSSVDLDKNLDWIINDFDGFLSYPDLVFPKDINCKDEHIRVQKKTKQGFLLSMTLQKILYLNSIPSQKNIRDDAIDCCSLAPTNGSCSYTLKVTPTNPITRKMENNCSASYVRYK